MTDIHTHILFGVDDGASCEEEAVLLLRQAFQEGIRRIVLTPHYREGMFETDAATIRHNFSRLCERAEKILPELKLFLGREIYLPVTDKGRLEDMGLAEGGFILAEFSLQAGFGDICNYVYEFLQEGLCVVLAHIERYPMLSAEEIGRLRKIGCYTQVNAQSVLGKALLSPKENVKKRARNLLARDLVDLIASDVHHLDKRTNRMSEAYDFIKKKYGADRARRLFLLGENSLPVALFGEGEEKKWKD